MSAARAGRPGVKQREYTPAELGRMQRAYDDWGVPMNDLARRFGCEVRRIHELCTAMGSKRRPVSAGRG